MVFLPGALSQEVCCEVQAGARPVSAVRQSYSDPSAGIRDAEVTVQLPELAECPSHRRRRSVPATGGWSALCRQRYRSL
jgi:hypothetical protein